MRRDLAGAKSEAGAVLARALLRAAGSLGLSQKDLARVLGISEATTSRLLRGRTVNPASKEGELGLLFLRVFRSLDALVGGREESAREWLHARNKHLGRRPSDMIVTVEGLVHVAEYLDAMRGKV